MSSQIRPVSVREVAQGIRSPKYGVPSDHNFKELELWTKVTHRGVLRKFFVGLWTCYRNLCYLEMRYNLGRDFFFKQVWQVLANRHQLFTLINNFCSYPRHTYRAWLVARRAFSVHLICSHAPYALLTCMYSYIFSIYSRSSSLNHSILHRTTQSYDGAPQSDRRAGKWPTLTATANVGDILMQAETSMAPAPMATIATGATEPATAIIVMAMVP